MLSARDAEFSTLREQPSAPLEQTNEEVKVNAAWKPMERKMLKILLYENVKRNDEERL